MLFMNFEVSMLNKFNVFIMFGIITSNDRDYL